MATMPPLMLSSHQFNIDLQSPILWAVLVLKADIPIYDNGKDQAILKYPDKSRIMTMSR